MRSLFLSATTFAAIALATASAAPVAAAQIVPGSTFSFTGTADATDIGLGGVILDFTPRIVANASGNTGTFASFNAQGGPGMSGQINDIRVGNGPQHDPDFLVLGGYRFTLDSLPSGHYGQDDCYVDPAPGQTCAPYQSVQGDPSTNVGVSPFYVSNVDSGNPDAPINATAAFDLFGTVTGPGGTTSSFVGTIAASFDGMPYQYVLYTLEQEGLQGLVFTGTFTAGAVIGATDAGVVPEPATYALVAAGMLGIGAVTRRQRRTSRAA